MSEIYKDIIQAQRSGRRLLSVLIDPEKVNLQTLPKLISQLQESPVSHILVGGSTDVLHQTEGVVHTIKSLTSIPVLLFPGHYNQITETADALLFLSLISGRNPEYLIDQQVKGAAILKNSDLELIATGYILLDGGNKTAVAEISKTVPIDQEQVDRIVHTALAGQYLGHQLLYLEAGSGAKYPVQTSVIRAVKEEVRVPLIVGGGIRTQQQVEAAYKAGADMVVVGTAFEENEHFFKQIIP